MKLMPWSRAGTRAGAAPAVSAPRSPDASPPHLRSKTRDRPGFSGRARRDHDDRGLTACRGCRRPVRLSRLGEHPAPARSPFCRLERVAIAIAGHTRSFAIRFRPGPSTARRTCWPASGMHCGPVWARRPAVDWRLNRRTAGSESARTSGESRAPAARIPDQQPRPSGPVLDLRTSGPGQRSRAARRPGPGRRLTLPAEAVRDLDRDAHICRSSIAGDDRRVRASWPGYVYAPASGSTTRAKPASTHPWRSPVRPRRDTSRARRVGMTLASTGEESASRPRLVRAAGRSRWSAIEVFGTTASLRDR